MNRKSTKTATGGTMFRAPSYFVWNHRKHASSSPRFSAHVTAANTNMNNTQDQDGTVGDSGPSPRKMRSTRRVPGLAGADNQSTDTKSSVLSGDSGGPVTISPKHKDPDRIKKDREREERVRQARERLEQERKRKLVDLQEQQRQAQENRERQLEMRRKKIEDLRRRDVERRAEVEKRRRERENAERSRRETLLLKAEERVARYEAWKRSGQKGPPPGGVMPTAKHLSASTGVLYHKRNFASSGVLNDTGRPESLLERSRPRGPATARRGEEKEEKKGGEKSGVKMSRRTLERLSTPRQMASIMGDKELASTPKRETVARMSAQKSYSTSNLTVSPKKSTTREKTPREAPAKPQQPEAGDGAAAAAAATAAAGTTTPPAPSSGTPTHTPKRVVSPTPGADEDGGSTVPATRPTPSAAEKTPSSAEKAPGDISAEEYKARLAEKRRQAREKAEREAEEERKRQEELARQEEERLRREEEEQRRQDEEAMRLAEEARKAEEERLQKAIEAEEARKAEEAARLEQERLAKEEAERKAKEEAERLEQEKQEKARREEEERLERKKRLEMIMKRVKTESPAEGATKDGPPKSVTSSPAKSITSTASSDVSPTEPDNKTVQAMAAQSAAAEVGGQSTTQDTPAQEESELQDRGVAEEEVSRSPVPSGSPITTSDQQTAQGDSEQDKPAELMDKPGVTEGTQPAEVVPDQVSSVPSSPVPPTEGGTERPKFKSPLLQKLVEGKDDGGSTTTSGPRFKSPLLQNLLGKTKMRSMGSSQEHCVSDPNLAGMESGTRGQGDGDIQAAPLISGVMSSSMVEMGTSDSSQKEVRNNNEEKDVDTSEESSSSHSSPSRVSSKHIVSNGNEDISIAVSARSHEDVSSAVQPEPMEISTPMESSATAAIMAASAASFWSEQDSGVVLGSDELHSAAPSGVLQVSLNGHGPARLAHSQDLEDSSISMRSVESVTSSITDSAAGSVFSSVTSLPPGQGLSAGEKEFEEVIELPVNNKSSSSATAPSTLTVLHNADDLVNFNKLEEGSEQTTAVPPPIIAFEDRRQDVPDLLS